MPDPSPRPQFVDDTVLSVDEGGVPALRGATCEECAATTFPVQELCPRCARGAMKPCSLPRTGTVWSWTVQHFPPGPPYLEADGAFRPFAVGYVDLGDVLVESRLVDSDEWLRIGAQVELDVDVLGKGAAARTVPVFRVVSP